MRRVKTGSVPVTFHPSGNPKTARPGGFLLLAKSCGQASEKYVEKVSVQG